MSTRYRPRHLVLAGAMAFSLSVWLAAVTTSAAATSVTTAWHNGTFSLDVGGVVSRSDVVLGTPNTHADAVAATG